MVVFFNFKLPILLRLTQSTLSSQQTYLSITWLSCSENYVTPFLEIFPNQLNLVDTFKELKETLVIFCLLHFLFSFFLFIVLLDVQNCLVFVLTYVVLCNRVIFFTLLGNQQFDRKSIFVIECKIDGAIPKNLLDFFNHLFVALINVLELIY